LTVLAAIFGALVAGHAFAQAANAIEQVTVTRGASGRTVVRVTLKEVPANPPAGFGDRQPAARPLDFSTRRRAHHQPACRRQHDAAQPELRAGGQSHPRRVHERAADVQTRVEGRDVLVTLAETARWR
jgi:hypothetical protein